MLDRGGAEVTPIDTATGLPGVPIPVGAHPVAVAFTPDGLRAYVASFGANTVTPIDVASLTAGPPIPVGQGLDALAVTPDDRTVEVVAGDADTLTPIDVASGVPGAAMPLGYAPFAIAFSPATGTGYVASTISGTLTPVSGGRLRAPIRLGLYSYPQMVAITADGATAVAVGSYPGQVSIVDLRTGHAFKPIKTGAYPAAAALVP